MNRNEWGDLACFVVVAEERSFTRAAARVGVSQSALSHTLRRLEERLGLRLLARTTRNIGLTEAGAQLYASVKPALEGIRESVASLDALRTEPAGHIRLTCSRNAAQRFVMPVVNRLLAEHPKLHIEMSVDHRLTDIVGEGFDAGVRLGEQVAKDMIAVRISPDIRMAVVASPDYLRRQGRPQTPDDLTAHACINLRLPTLGGLYAWELEKDGRAVNVKVEGRFTCNDAQMIVDAASEGLGLACMPEDVVLEDLAAGRLVRVLEDWCPPFPGYHLYYPGRRQHSPAFALLVDALRWRGA